MVGEAVRRTLHRTLDFELELGRDWVGRSDRGKATTDRLATCGATLVQTRKDGG